MPLQSSASPESPKAMSFRTTVGQHELMAEAARQEDMSLNAWMNKVLAEAVAGVSPKRIYDFPQPTTDAICALLDDPDNNIELVGRLIGLLEDRSHRAVLRFSNALAKYLSGLDAVWPYWHQDFTQRASEHPLGSRDLASSLAYLTQGLAAPLSTLPNSATEAEVMELSNALRLYVAGFYAVMPYLSSNLEVKTRKFVNIIQASIQEVEGQGRLQEQGANAEIDSVSTEAELVFEQQTS